MVKKPKTIGVRGFKSHLLKHTGADYREKNPLHFFMLMKP